MKNDGLTLNQLAERNAVLVSEVEKLRAERDRLAAENVQIKAMNDCLSEELRGYESDGAFEGPKMHLLWWQVETPATDRVVAGIKADGVEQEANECYGAGYICETLLAYAQQLREGAK